MLTDLLPLLWAPFLMCLVLTGIHAYLGFHVLAREVVFVDIALAQIAALGATAAFLAGFPAESWPSYAAGLAATTVGALVLALTRTRERRVSQEAVIGVVYAVSAAAAVLLVASAPHGADHLRGMLVGSIITVSGAQVAAVGLLYAAVGALHWWCRRPFFAISADPEAAFAAGYRVRAWDFLFYASFGVVVTSSVRIAGVLLVFAYLIVPALVGVALSRDVRVRLLVGWTFGALVSVLGITASAALDLPTGAAVVCTFGAALLAGWLLLRLTRWRPAARLTALAAAVALLAACEQGPPAPSAPSAGAPPARPQVIASFYPLQEFARRVAGDSAEVGALVPTGVEPHDWAPSPEDVARIAKARVFIKNGGGFEPWADKLLANLEGKGPQVVDATAGIELLPGDAHVWLDPVLAQAQVETIRAGLTAADPSRAGAHAAGAAAFRAELAALHARFEQGLAACARREIVVSHAAFGYPARRYGLTQVPIMGLSPEAEPSPAELARIARFARQRGVTHVFFESLVGPKLAETLAREIGARTLVLNPIEGLTREEAAAGKGYTALMDDNLRSLRTGLQCR